MLPRPSVTSRALGLLAAALVPVLLVVQLGTAATVSADPPRTPPRPPTSEALKAAESTRVYVNRNSTARQTFASGEVVTKMRAQRRTYSFGSAGSCRPGTNSGTTTCVSAMVNRATGKRAGTAYLGVVGSRTNVQVRYVSFALQ